MVKVNKKIDDLKVMVADFPQTPGVYLMKNQAEQVIYVGKAKKLKNRVRSYFNKSSDKSVKTKYLVSHIDSIDYILTKTEVEAFLLEASLIKKYRPRYNIRLKDDKAYPYIRCSLEDEFPRFYLARKVKGTKSIYFGPYTSGYIVRGTIDYLNGEYQIRDCSDSYMKSRKRPCMTHQIGRCKAPCTQLVEAKEYGEDIKGAIQLLKKEKKTLLKSMEQEMFDASEEERFEQAAKLRDQLKSLKSIWEKQVVVDKKGRLDQDIIAVTGDERGSLFETLHIRSGQLIGQRSFFFKKLNIKSESEDPKEWFTSFLAQYYVDNIIPDEVVIEYDLGTDILKLMSDLFAERGNKNTRVIHTVRGERRQLLLMAQENAISHFNKKVSKVEVLKKGLEVIRSKFKLSQLPYRIECYDVSHFQADEVVASQVVFEGGVANKEEYRRYKLSQNINDDYLNMKEVLERRFKHTEYDDPHLIVIDGGKGQLNVAVRVLEEINRPDIPVVSLAKARSTTGFEKTEVTGTEERFFLPGRQNPVIFRSGSTPFQILVSLRNEAHRFAISYHRMLRKKGLIQSELDSIQGVGPQKKKALLEEFGSVANIKKQSADQLARLPGVNKDLAKLILESLNPMPLD